MYFNMAIVDAKRPHPFSDTPSPKRFGTVSPLDPEFFLSCDEFADDLLKGERSGKYSPLWVAAQLEDNAENAAAHLRKAKSKARDLRSAEFRRLAVDVTIQAGLGRFFAAKFRAGVLYAIYLRNGHRAALEEALRAYRAAHTAWADLANAAKNVYRDDVTFGPEYFQRGHWLDRLPALEADIADMEKLLNPPTPAEATAAADRRVVEETMRTVLSQAKLDQHPPLAGFHIPPASFRRGRQLAIVARVPEVSNLHSISGVNLRHRRVNQAEAWQMVQMMKSAGEYHATIAAEFTDSPFPLQYHFQIRTRAGDAWLYPGLERRWNGQPYYVVRQA
jgi:hypothetical protein